MKVTNFLFVLFLIYSGLNAQDNYHKHIRLIQVGDSLFRLRQFQLAAINYSASLDLIKDGEIQPHPGLIYNTACSWALAGDIEKAFYYLKIAIQKGYSDIENLMNDTDLESLHTDKRWQGLQATIKEQQQKQLEKRQRLNYIGDSEESIFLPMTGFVRTILENDSLPLISVNHKGFILYFTGSSYTAKHLSQLKKELDEALERVLNVLNIDYCPRGIRLLFFDSKNEMKRHTGFSVGGGIALLSTDLVLFLNGGERRVQLRHELFHMMSSFSWSESPTFSPPEFLNEGGAVYTDNNCYYENPIYSINAFMLKKDLLFPLELLTLDFRKYADKEEVRSYLQAAGVFKYLYEKHGVEKMKQLWRSGFGHFHQIYGLTLQEFEKEWIHFISTISPPKDMDWNNLIDNGCG